MLLVYFSRAGENWQVGYVERGNTAIMADYIREQADVDVFEIVPEVSIRDASSKQTVENWLKKLGVDKQSTAITNVRTRSVENGVSYTLNGMPFDNQRGLYIKRSAEGRLQGKNGKKYVSK